LVKRIDNIRFARCSICIQRFPVVGEAIERVHGVCTNDGVIGPHYRPHVRHASQVIFVGPSHELVHFVVAVGVKDTIALRLVTRRSFRQQRSDTGGDAHLASCRIVRERFLVCHTVVTVFGRENGRI
jgi:hypothetical protein